MTALYSRPELKDGLQRLMNSNISQSNRNIFRLLHNR